MQLGPLTLSWQPPASPSLCADLYNTAVRLVGESRSTQAAGLVLGACCPELGLQPPDWDGVNLSRFASRCGDALLKQADAVALIALVREENLIPRLKEQAPITQSESEAARKNS